MFFSFSFYWRGKGEIEEETDKRTPYFKISMLSNLKHIFRVFFDRLNLLIL